jgi:hypothetical protein
MNNPVEVVYQEVQGLPKELKNLVLGLLDDASGDEGGSVVAFWQKNVLATGGKGTPLQREVDSFVQYVDDTLALATEQDKLDWISEHHKVVVCGTYGGATSFVSNFISGCPGYSLSHERVYRNNEIQLKPSMAGFIKGDCSGAAWKYVDRIHGPKIIHLLRHPLAACGSMMNNPSPAVPKTFKECAEYWYAHTRAVESTGPDFVTRVEEWRDDCEDLLWLLDLELVQGCFTASEGTRRNPQGGERPWTWDDLPEHVRETGEEYGYGP